MDFFLFGQQGFLRLFLDQLDSCAVSVSGALRHFQQPSTHWPRLCRGADRRVFLFGLLVSLCLCRLMIRTLRAVHHKGVGIERVRGAGKEGHAVLDHSRRGSLSGVGLSGDCEQEASHGNECEEEDDESEEE
jgi:hypothetical protein